MKLHVYSTLSNDVFYAIDTQTHRTVILHSSMPLSVGDTVEIKPTTQDVHIVGDHLEIFEPREPYVYTLTTIGQLALR